MNNLMRLGIHRMNPSTVWPAVSILLLALSVPATAALGGDLTSVQNDAAHMKGQLQVKQESGYSVHEMKIPGNTIVREYVSPEGKVFGVSWQGAFIPDMQQLLGSNFEKYSQAVQSEKAKYVGRRPLNIHQSGLVIETAGHMRSYFGRVYDPQLMPAGVKEEDIR
jgi:Protein of unknown function (DUF2844)